MTNKNEQNLHATSDLPTLETIIGNLKDIKFLDKNKNSIIFSAISLAALLAFVSPVAIAARRGNSWNEIAKDPLFIAGIIGMATCLLTLAVCSHYIIKAMQEISTNTEKTAQELEKTQEISTITKRAAQEVQNNALKKLTNANEKLTKELNTANDELETTRKKLESLESQSEEIRKTKVLSNGRIFMLQNVCDAKKDKGALHDIYQSAKNKLAEEIGDKKITVQNIAEKLKDLIESEDDTASKKLALNDGLKEYVKFLTNNIENKTDHIKMSYFVLVLMSNAAQDIMNNQDQQKDATAKKDAAQKLLKGLTEPGTSAAVSIDNFNEFAHQLQQQINHHFQTLNEAKGLEKLYGLFQNIELEETSAENKKAEDQAEENLVIQDAAEIKEEDNNIKQESTDNLEESQVKQSKVKGLFKKLQTLSNGNDAHSDNHNPKTRVDDTYVDNTHGKNRAAA